MLTLHVFQHIRNTTKIEDVTYKDLIQSCLIHESL